MKRLLFILILGFTISYSSAQSLSNYFYNNGVATFAYFAHPMSTYERGTYNVRNNYVQIDVYYTDDTYFQAKVYYKYIGGNYMFTDLVVTDYNAWWPPFGTSIVVKELIIELLKPYLKDYEEQLPISSNSLDYASAIDLILAYTTLELILN